MIYSTKAFENLPPEKQAKVMAAAAAEFAEHGYDVANTNHIARRAGISVGSLFQYFKTKKDLFLGLVDYETNRLLFPVLEKAKEAPDVFVLFRLMLLEAREFGLEYPDQNKLYLLVTAGDGSSMTPALARRLESMTIACYRRAMRRSREQGIIRDGVDDGFAAFQLDSLVLMFQFSFSSEYFRERLISYTCLDPLTHGDAVIDALCGMADMLLRKE